jgi:hypothetical protein
MSNHAKHYCGCDSCSTWRRVKVQDGRTMTDIGGAREAVALLADLRDRLARADSDLTAMAAAATGPSFTQARIGGKRDGVRLALSYLDEIERSQDD